MFWAQVVDAETRSPLDAEVTVRSANRQVFRQRADTDGFVSHEMRTGRYTVIAQMDGYTGYRQSVTHNKLDTLLIALQPISIFTVRVIDAETGDNLQAEVTVNNTALPNNPQVFKQTTDAANGMLTYELRPGRYSLHVASDGHIYHNEAFEFSRTETITVVLQPIKKDARIIVHNIFFEINSAIITPESEPAIEDLYQFLLENPSLHVHFVGHTDNTGTHAFNMTLSENRAKALYDAIVRKGIDPERLTFEGRGFTEPIAPNDTEEGRAENRRVEFISRYGITKN
jgi:outer membrane protein OmpA-like peptidoglycan-associated protein